MARAPAAGVATTVIWRLASLALIFLILPDPTVTVTDASAGPPANYTIGCLATVSIYGGVPYDFHNPAPLTAFNCPSNGGCDPDSRVSAFLYQIDRINREKILLPNTTLIAECRDDQGDSSRGLFAALELLKVDANNGTGIPAVFGTYYSRVALNAALVLRGLNVPLIAWGASSPDLSNKKLYPNFGRVCESDSSQAAAMAFLAAKSFGWSSVALIYSSDSYGSGGASAFAAEFLNSYNRTLVADEGVIVGASESDVEVSLQRIKAIGVQTIVFYGLHEEFWSIFKRGSRPDLDLFNNQTAWLLSGDTVTGWAPGSTDWENALASGALNGVFGFSSNDGRTTPVYQQWVKDYLNRNITGMNPLITVSPTSVDQMMVYDSYAVDDANLAATALKTMFDAGNYAPTPTDWYNAIHNINMQGITGKIAFDSKFERIGIAFTLNNIQGGAWREVGTYVDQTLSITAPLQFADGTSNPPPSFPLPPPPQPPNTSVISESSSHTLLAFTILVLVITTFYGVCLTLGRELKVFQNASVTMMGVILLGGYLVCVSVLVALQTQSQSTCTVQQWLFNVGFQLTIGAILLKTYRVHAIFNSHKLQVTSLTDRTLLIGVASLIGFDIIVLILRTAISPYQLSDRLVCEFKSGSENDAATALSLILIITKALLLLYTAYLTYRVRNLPSRFNESSYISVAVYNTALICIIWVVIRYAVSTDTHPDLINVFECSLKLIGTALILTLIFLPKCVTALRPMVRKVVRGKGSSTKSQGNSNGISMLSSSADEGGNNPKSPGGTPAGKRTQAELEALIDATVTSQTELLQRAYAQLDQMQANMGEKKRFIQNSIDLLRQLDEESKFFKECVAKQLTEKQICRIFENRLMDITIPQEGQLGAGVTFMPSTMPTRPQGILSGAAVSSAPFPRTSGGNSVIASPTRGSLGREVSSTSIPLPVPRISVSQPTPAGPASSSKLHSPAAAPDTIIIHMHATDDTNANISNSASSPPPPPAHDSALTPMEDTTPPAAASVELTSVAVAAVPSSESAPSLDSSSASSTSTTTASVVP